MKNDVVQKVRDALTPTVSITKAEDLPGGGTAFEVTQEYSGLPWPFPISKRVYVCTDDEGERLETKGI